MHAHSPPETKAKTTTRHLANAARPIWAPPTDSVGPPMEESKKQEVQCKYLLLFPKTQKLIVCTATDTIFYICSKLVKKTFVSLVEHQHIYTFPPAVKSLAVRADRVPGVVWERHPKKYSGRCHNRQNSKL